MTWTAWDWIGVALGVSMSLSVGYFGLPFIGRRRRGKRAYRRFPEANDNQLLDLRRVAAGSARYWVERSAPHLAGDDRRMVRRIDRELTYRGIPIPLKEDQHERNSKASKRFTHGPS